MSTDNLYSHRTSIMETKIIVEDGLTVSGKSLREVYEATGNAKAFDFMMSLVQNLLFSEQDILELHRLFFQQIDSQQAGHYRQIMVFISGTNLKLPQPEEVPHLMSLFVKNLHSKKKAHPIAIAAWAHNEFVTILPFIVWNILRSQERGMMVIIPLLLIFFLV